jgi:DNA-binding GntR family transcriptional regulator
MKKTYSKNKTINSVIYGTLRKQILDGEILPGTWLREQDLVEQYDVSRTPIREAIRKLESDKLIEVVPFRGAKVINLQPDEIWGEYLVRAALEGFALEMAVSRIPEEAIDKLCLLQDKMDKFLDAEDLDKYLVANRQFHMLMYGYCGSKRLISMIEDSWDRANLYRLKILLSKPSALGNEKANHRELLQACRTRDGDKAREIIKSSMLRGASTVTGIGMN